MNEDRIKVCLGNKKKIKIIQQLVFMLNQLLNFGKDILIKELISLNGVNYENRFKLNK